MFKPFRAISSIALCAVMMFTATVAVSAAEPETTEAENTTITTCSSEEGIEPQVEYEIIWKYRMYKGKMQRRRWNMTLGIWADLMWQDC